MSQPSAAALALILLLAASASAAAKDTLFGGQSLKAGQFLQRSPYKFIMQSDCNLVLYTGKKALWASGTYGQGGGATCIATLQTNGNLAVKAGSNVLWTSNTARGQRSYHLVVQGDGNVVIYGPAVWATNTVQGGSKLRRLM